jgi:type IV pilus assembly protein PilC
MLAAMRKNTPLGRRLVEIQSRISEGSSLADALRSDVRTWGSMVCALIGAGEASGSLDAAFRRVADLLNARIGLRRKILGALTYPIMVLVITIVLVAALLIVVVPRFKDIYASLGSELPALTQFIVGISGNAPAVLLAVVVLVAAVFVVLSQARRRPELGYKVDRVKLKLPVVGPLVAKGVYARVASTLSSLLSAGVPMLEALDFAAESAGSEPHRRDLAEVRRAIADGATLTSALSASGLWPDLMIQLVTVGEEAGSLPDMAERYAKRSLEEVDLAAGNLTKLIEPLLMVVIGVVVGVFLLALYLPIFNLGSQLR